MRKLLALVSIMSLFGLLANGPPAIGQSAYSPAVAPAANYNGGGYGYPGGYGATTAAGSAMQGASSMVRAAGEYNLNTSAAAVNMTQAQKNEIQNYSQWTNTYFETRAVNRQARAAERGPQPTEEQLIRMAQMGKPKRLTTSDLDPVTGTLNWPMLLTAADFTAGRAELDKCFADRASKGAIGLKDFGKVRQTTQEMLSTLEASVRDLPPNQYMAAKRFLQSVAYEAGLPHG